MKRIFGILAAAIMMSALATSCDNGGLGNGEKLPFIPDEDEILLPELKPELMDNTFIIDGKTYSLGSAAVANIGDNIGVVACKKEGIASYEEILEQDEYLFIAIAPNLNGDTFSLTEETSTFTIISSLKECWIETIAPGLTDEIREGECLFTYEDNKATATVKAILSDGREFEAKVTAEKKGVVVNENSISFNGVEKPVRAVFHMIEDGLTYLYITPAGISYAEELEVATYYAYIILEDEQCDGSAIDAKDLIALGVCDNVNETVTDSSEKETTGTVSVERDSDDETFYTITADVNIGGETLVISYSGNAMDFLEEPEEKYEVIYNGVAYEIEDVVLDKTVGNGLWRVVMDTTGEEVTITLPSTDFDGNAKGFSQFQKNPDVKVTYGDDVYNKATGSSGTITIGIDGETIRVEFTNYDNFEILYEGDFTTME